ncbi:MAG: 3-deoxy-7-phosphoheptulonate synthase class II [Pirellulaceae bacterium]
MTSQRENSIRDWSPGSWRNRPATQQPTYRDENALGGALERLRKLPPLVTSWEIESLKRQLADVQKGDAFLLQGGDCSESLDDCSTAAIVRNLKVLMQMSFVLIYGSMRRVVRVGRIAGQYAKPRSSDLETRGNTTLPVYRGDIVNRSGFSESEREPDPELMLRGYERSALTLNFIRSLIGGGFADLHHPENWELDFPTHSPREKEYREMVHSITNSLRFMEAVLSAKFQDSYGVEFFTSHEALLLAYEEAQTRRVPRRTGYYNLSTHLPWIGYRTNQVDGAHVEYIRGIDNPIGIKVGPETTPEQLLELARIVNPSNEAGKLVLVHRFGATKVNECLPSLIDTAKSNNLKVVWCCDPMHGNTFATEQGIKTRSFDSVFQELLQAFDIHNEMGSYLGGVHLELTGDNVTECIGGSGELAVPDLSRAYKSAVDPRLNYDQAMELAFLISNRIANRKNG